MHPRSFSRRLLIESIKITSEYTRGGNANRLDKPTNILRLHADSSARASSPAVPLNRGSQDNVRVHTGEPLPRISRLICHRRSESSGSDKPSETEGMKFSRDDQRLTSRPSRFGIVPTEQSARRIGPFTETRCARNATTSGRTWRARTRARISFILISFALFNAERLVISWGS